MRIGGGALETLDLQALAPATQLLLPRLAARPWAGDVYLAGSAGLTLHLAHRPVRDLDLMSAALRLVGPERRDLLADLTDLADLAHLEGGVRVETARDGYLFARLGGVGLKLFHYPYPLIEAEAEAAGLAVASLADLGLMKLAAVISRGERRDFMDLYLLCRRVPLAALLDRAPEKFGHVGDFALQALKGLADHRAAAAEPAPRLALPLAWEEVEAWLAAEVRRLGRACLGLAP